MHACIFSYNVPSLMIKANVQVFMLQQKVVIRVTMVDQKKSRTKAMKIAATAFGTYIYTHMKLYIYIYISIYLILSVHIPKINILIIK